MSEVCFDTRRNLASAIRELGRTKDDLEDQRDQAELIRVAARFVERCDDIDLIHSCFGAPGDWGYDTKIGQCLSWLYRTKAPKPGLLST